jgi:hypothetical protein
MEANFQNRTKFTYSLLAFLPLARSVTFVFKKQFHEEEMLMTWYKTKVEEWKKNKIMKFFNEMRNATLKEHTPGLRSTSKVTWGIDFIIGTPPPVEIEKAEDGREIWRGELPIKSSEVLEYSFNRLPKWFDENPNVMHLCSKYLEELQRFVVEAESKMTPRSL